MALLQYNADTKDDKVMKNIFLWTMQTCIKIVQIFMGL